MCDPISVGLAIVGTAGAMKYQSDEADKQRNEMKKQQKEAEERARAEKNAQRGNQLSAANPILINKGGQSAKGLDKLKVPSKSTGGYNALGMGGSNSTGLNISN